MPKLQSVLTKANYINKTDVVTLLETFGNFRNICTASEQQMVLCPGIGEKKVKRLHRALHAPFMLGGEEESKELDYVNNVVISFLDRYTIMSHTNLTKLKEIKSSLIMNGILDVETRKKGEVYSLVYRSSQKPQPPHLN